MTTTPPPSANTASPQADTPPPRAPSRSNRLAWPLLLLLLIASAVALVAYAWNISRAQREDTARNQQRLSLLERQLGSLHSELAAATARLQRAETAAQALREDVDALNQRTAQIEDTPPIPPPAADLGEINAAITTLRLDQAELLLTLAAQRAQHDGDPTGARALTAQADTILAHLPEPDFAEARETLAAELGALSSVTEHPRIRAIKQIDALLARVDALDSADATPTANTAANAATTLAPPAPRTWWQRALASWVEIRPTAANAGAASTPPPAEPPPALHALRRELTLARTHLARGDAESTRRALHRAHDLTEPLPDTHRYQLLRDELQAVQQHPLTLDVSALGSTLEQLRAQRRERRNE